MVNQAIMLVGLGECAVSHRDALKEFESKGYSIVAGVDIDSSKRNFFPAKSAQYYEDIKTAALNHPDINIIVIATPTPTHYDVYNQICKAFSGRPIQILIEKPCSDRYEDIMLMLNGSKEVRPTALLHFAYSPEVLWALKKLGNWLKQNGPICKYQAFFADPRNAPEQAHKRAALSSSWKDTGINALSVAYRFVDILGVALQPACEPFDYEATVAFQSDGHKGTGSITTQWNSAISIYISSFVFANGARLTLDHYSVRGSFDADGITKDTFAGNIKNRRLSHYKNLYNDLFVDKKLIITPSDALKLHQLLLADTRKL